MNKAKAKAMWGNLFKNPQNLSCLEAEGMVGNFALITLQGGFALLIGGLVTLLAVLLSGLASRIWVSVYRPVALVIIANLDINLQSDPSYHAQPASP